MIDNNRWIYYSNNSSQPPPKKPESKPRFLYIFLGDLERKFAPLPGGIGGQFLGGLGN